MISISAESVTALAVDVAQTYSHYTHNTRFLLLYFDTILLLKMKWFIPTSFVEGWWKVGASPQLSSIQYFTKVSFHSPAKLLFCLILKVRIIP